ncbi:MAG: hypothetical protein K2N38_13865 [Oscillospiraceae bacterium]|nr:hypothetical protein [Oscillospiraceae bacterium]
MKKYCSVCKQPLANPNAFACDKCGKPTTPIDFFDRVASDNYLSGKEKKLLEFIGIMNIVACVISLIMWIVLVSLFASAGKTLTAQWNAGLIEQTVENAAAVEVSKMITRGFVIIGVIMIIEQLGSLFFGVMILLKKVWAVQVSRVLYIVNAVLYFIGGNIISGIISVYLAVKLNGMISRMEGGSEYNRRSAEDAKKAAEIANDKTVWQCKNCGYVNPIAMSECKSCGKWRN